MSSFTAKVVLGSVIPETPNASRLSFYPDYAEGRNQEWAASTPALSLSMNVIDTLVEKLNLKPGQKFTLTFEPEIKD